MLVNIRLYLPNSLKFTLSLGLRKTDKRVNLKFRITKPQTFKFCQRI